MVMPFVPFDKIIENPKAFIRDFLKGENNANISFCKLSYFKSGKDYNLGSLMNESKKVPYLC